MKFYNKIKLIGKTILLWVTIVTTMTLLCGIDSTLENGSIVLWIVIVIALVYISSKLINRKEFNIISGNNIFNKILGNKVDEEL